MLNPDQLESFYKVNSYFEVEWRLSFALCQPRQPVPSVTYDIYAYESAIYGQLLKS
jgi:hypothetical protein